MKKIYLFNFLVWHFFQLTAQVNQSSLENYKCQFDQMLGAEVADTLKYQFLLDSVENIERHTSPLPFIYLKKGIALAKANDQIVWRGRLNSALGELYVDINEKDSAVMMHELALSDFKEVNDITRIAQEYRRISYLHSFNNKQTESIEYAYKEISMHEQSGNTNGIADAYLTIATNHYQLEVPQEAKIFGKKALAVYQENNHLHGIAHAYSVLSRFYYDSLDIALNYINQSIDISENDSLAVLSWLVRSYTRRIDIYEKMKLYNKVQKEIEFIERIPSNKLRLAAKQFLTYKKSINHFNLGNYEKSKNIALNIINDSLASVNPYMDYAYTHLVESYAKLNRFDSAYHYHMANHEWENEINSDKRAHLERMNVKALEVQYETGKKEATITAQKDRIFQQRIIQGFALGFAALLGLLLFISIKNARIRKQTNEKLKELDTLKNRLFTNITHEFRTPLTVIAGMATQIQEHPQKWLDEGATMIKRNSNVLLDLVNQMLDLSKLESGKIQLLNQQGDIVTFLKYIVESIHSFAESENIQVHFHSENETINTDFDPEKIQRVMINLLSNAVKFTPAGGHVYVSVNIKSNARTERNRSRAEVEIKIRDTGKGIAEDQLPFIFNRFYQVDASSTKSEAGSGIGLALVRELIKLMEGDISVKSTLGKETEFTILLPINNNAPTMQDALHDPSNKKIGFPFSKTDHQSTIAQFEKSNGANNETHPRVLIIEDNADVVAYMVSCLQDQYNIQVAPNGQEGIDRAIESIPDLIITDVMMPIKDGFEVTKFLKADERTSHIPIIMLTAKADVASKLEGLKRGADAYLAKPFDKDELKIRMEQLILMRQKLASRYASGQITNLPPTQDEDIKIEDAFLIKINGLIHAQLSNAQYSVGELMSDAGMSRSQLYRKLKALTNRSIVAYIRLVRLQESLQLLKQSDKNISEIAYDVGFSDPAYFSRAFTQEFGKSPIQYQEGER